MRQGLSSLYTMANKREIKMIDSHSVYASNGVTHGEQPGCFTLTNIDSNSQATITLDYGHCSGGIPVLVVDTASSQDLLQLQIVYSETAQGIGSETGDGPFFLFSNAMDSYRSTTITISPSSTTQIIKASQAQRSQRYQKITLLSPDSSIRISRLGFEPVRPSQTPKASFQCSDESLNRIWNDGVRTLDMCSVEKGETAPSWHVTEDGTRVFGQHWAPCRQGTRWGDKVVTFEVRVEEHGASWGVHMVANGIIFCLDMDRLKLFAYEGLSHQASVFPVKNLGSWSIDGVVEKGTWITVVTTTISDTIEVLINGNQIASLDKIGIRPILGGDVNTGSVAFGGPESWKAMYRNLLINDANGSRLYENDMKPDNKNRLLEDFQVGTNYVACMVDGAKRDRACFGGDLFVSGRGVAYAGLDMAAVAGSIELLTSHQTEDGYLGNLCPIQAPIYRGDEPPTYAFYSLTYALLLVVAIKDYWMHSGDDTVVERCLPRIEKLFGFVDRHVQTSGLIEAPPGLSMHWYPLGGPVFGASGTMNLAYHDALRAALAMTNCQGHREKLSLKADNLKTSILKHLWNPQLNTMRMGTALPGDGQCLGTNGYAATLGLAQSEAVTSCLGSSESTPLAFKGLGHWDSTGVVSPYATGFAVEALFSNQKGREAIALLQTVWGPMADPSDENYSGGHWEAMTADGKPFGHDTSLIHAWSTWPVFLLPQYVVGVKPLEPGWTRLQISPVPCGVGYGIYSNETTAGKVGVEMKMDETAGKLVLSLALPTGIMAEIVAPVGYSSDVGVVEGGMKREVCLYRQMETGDEV